MFKELDIRGKYPSEINEEKSRFIGIASSILFPNLVVGMDYRKHNKTILKAFAEGYGNEITLLGNVPTPALAFSSIRSGMMLTASHNPAEYVGMKFFRNRTYASREEMLE
ncbi:MAG: phosphomannomutase/phosphoglucomutase, partial [Candidatus Micrarchaeota archaeon]